MGVFSKLKNIFYDEEVIEETEKPKIEEIKVVEKKKEKPEEIVEPEVSPRMVFDKTEEFIKEEPEKTVNTFSERELFRSEKTFPFTEFDDEEDEDFKTKKNILDIQKNSRVASNNVESEKKVFRPSPIISPIYGILEKDYKKEDIVERKKEPIINPVEKTSRTYDSIRRKAYGTLEDELADTLTSNATKLTEQINDIEEEVGSLDTIGTLNTVKDNSSKIEDLITKIEKTSSISIGEIEEKAKDMMEEEEEKLELLDDKTMTDNTLEHDLFNLIDSMYDDKEE